MGYGLVAIPKQLWRVADVRGQQRLLCHRAGVLAEKVLAARRSFLNHCQFQVTEDLIISSCPLSQQRICVCILPQHSCGEGQGK